jgi:anti-sigma B factor antagonist
MTSPNKLLEYAIRDVTIVVFQNSSVLDALVVQEIGESLYYLVDEKACRKVIIDFSKVHTLSSSALGILIQLKKKADAIKGQVVLCGVRKELMKIFTMTHLHTMFEFRPDEKTALAVFGLTTAG